MAISGIGQSMSMSSLYGMQRPSANDIANKIIKELDADGDGVLSTDEISKGGKRVQKLLKADTNKDGNVTLDELLSDITTNMKNRSMRPHNANGMASHIMDKLDTNGDGVLSADEINQAGDFAQKILGADANGDGNVTLDELASDISKMGDKMKQSEQANQSGSSLMDLALNRYDDVQALLDTMESSNLSISA